MSQRIFRAVVYGDKQPHYIVAQDLDAAKDALRESLTVRSLHEQRPNQPVWRLSIASIEELDAYSVLLAKGGAA